MFSNVRIVHICNLSKQWVRENSKYLKYNSRIKNFLSLWSWGLASGPPTLRFSQIWDFSENLSFSHQTVPPNKCCLKLKLIFEFFLQSEIFLKRACHQHFSSLTWGIKAEIFQKMLRLWTGHHHVQTLLCYRTAINWQYSFHYNFFSIGYLKK